MNRAYVQSVCFASRSIPVYDESSGARKESVPGPLQTVSGFLATLCVLLLGVQLLMGWKLHTSAIGLTLSLLVFTNLLIVYRMKHRYIEWELGRWLYRHLWYHGALAVLYVALIVVMF